MQHNLYIAFLSKRMMAVARDLASEEYFTSTFRMLVLSYRFQTWNVIFVVVKYDL